MDKNGKKSNFIDDDKNFYEVFPPDVYIPKDSFLPIKVLEVCGILLSIKNNPKVLIEGNETLLKILKDNLSSGKKLAKDIKQKIYNNVKKMPKDFYIENNIKIFGKKEKIPKETINTYCNYKDIYSFSYFIQCVYSYIKHNLQKRKKKKNFLKIF